MLPKFENFHERFSPITRQVFALIGAVVGFLAGGLSVGHTSIILEQLESNTTTIPITLDESSWIASMTALPIPICCFLGMYLMERYGRWTAMMISFFPGILGWVVIAAANNVTTILVGRFILGVSAGIKVPSGNIFLCEISDPKIRGVLMTMGAVSFSLGILIAHLLGVFISWKLLAALAAIFPLIGFIILLFCPESPAWLLKNGRLAESEKSFKWYRGTETEAMAEYETMLKKQNCGDVDKFSWTTIKENALKASFIKPLVIIIISFFVMQFSGKNNLAFYSVSIMKNTVGEGINEYLATIVLDSVRVVMMIASCFIVQKVGRRPLMLVSGTGTAVCLLAITSYLYMAASNQYIKSMGWIPLTLLIGYICFISIGLYHLPWCMKGELLPLSMRSFGSGIASFWNFVLFFVVVKTGPAMFQEFGDAGAFLFFGLVVFFGTIYFYFYLPETRNKTLQEIEDEFNIKSN